MSIRKANRINGLGINLRNVRVSDAAFILSLRTDPTLNQHISKVSGELSQQVAFLERYEACSDEAFFVVEDSTGVPLGTIRMYDQQDKSFCWGSWIIRPGAPPRTGTKSALLLYMYGFEYLNFSQSHFDVRQENSAVWRFHEKCGAQLICETEQDRFYILPRQAWEGMKKHYNSIITKSSFVFEALQS